MRHNRSFLLMLTGLLAAGFMQTALNAVPAKGKKTSMKYVKLDADPALENLSSQEKQKLVPLLTKKHELQEKMHVTRMELIRRDQRLTALRQKIIELSRQLSLELNAKREMIDLINELAVVEEEITKITGDLKTKKFSAASAVPTAPAVPAKRR